MITLNLRGIARATLAAALVAAAPAGALVRLGAGAAAGFGFPAAAFDNDAKSAPGAGLRLYVNIFHWLTLDGGADFYLPFAAESDTGRGETRLAAYRAGAVYKIHMGVFMPFLAAGYAEFDQRLRRDGWWEDVAAPGFYLAPGLEYFLSERFSATGALAYQRAFDGARSEGRDTQLVKLEFGVNYSYW
jgi:hypothetical protein